MKKVIIIGGGFAGLSALRILSRKTNNFEVILIDKKATFDFLPCLPDIIGERIQTKFLRYELKDICEKLGCVFIIDEVKKIDIDNKKVTISGKYLNYDYLLISSGSNTNFYGNGQIKKYAFKLDDSYDAQEILKNLSNDSIESFIVGGGGLCGH